MLIEYLKLFIKLHKSIQKKAKGLPFVKFKNKAEKEKYNKAWNSYLKRMKQLQSQQ